MQPSGDALVTTDYVNGFQYVDNALKFFPHTEGYVEFENNQYLYTYQSKDHLDSRDKALRKLSSKRPERSECTRKLCRC